VEWTWIDTVILVLAWVGLPCLAFGMKAYFDHQKDKVWKETQPAIDAALEEYKKYLK